MKSDLPKTLHKLAGKTLLAHVVDAARAVEPEKIVVITGHKKEMVQEAFRDQGVEFCLQEPQLGTGHALAQTEENFAGFSGPIIVLSGDVPMLKSTTIKSMLDTHQEQNAVVTLLTCELDDPGRYGRIIRSDGKVIANVEAKDATDEQLLIREINAGIYVFDAGFVYPALKRIGNNNAQGEYYLTDLIAIAVDEGRQVAAVKADNPNEIAGINTEAQLAGMEIIMEQEARKKAGGSSV